MICIVCAYKYNYFTECSLRRPLESNRCVSERRPCQALWLHTDSLLLEQMLVPWWACGFWLRAELAGACGESLSWLRSSGTQVRSCAHFIQGPVQVRCWRLQPDGWRGEGSQGGSLGGSVSRGVPVPDWPSGAAPWGTGKRAHRVPSGGCRAAWWVTGPLRGASGGPLLGRLCGLYLREGGYRPPHHRPVPHDHRKVWCRLLLCSFWPRKEQTGYAWLLWLSASSLSFPLCPKFFSLLYRLTVYWAEWKVGAGSLGLFKQVSLRFRTSQMHLREESSVRVLFLSVLLLCFRLTEWQDSHACVRGLVHLIFSLPGSS